MFSIKIVVGFLLVDEAGQRGPVLPSQRGKRAVEEGRWQPE